MLPIPHALLFLPIAVFAALFIAAAAVNFLAGARARPKARPAAPWPAAPWQAAPRPSAQIIYFRPGKTSLRSGLSFGAR